MTKTDNRLECAVNTVMCVFCIMSDSLSLSLSLSAKWVCQFCTYLNYSPATVCEMCDLARPEPAALPAKLRPPSPVRRVPALPIKSKEPASEDLDSCRQKLMKEEGLKLIQLIRVSHCP